MFIFYKCPDCKHDLVSEERSDLLLTSYSILLLMLHFIVVVIHVSFCLAQLVSSTELEEAF